MKVCETSQLVKNQRDKRFPVNMLFTAHPHPDRLNYSKKLPPNWRGYVAVRVAKLVIFFIYTKKNN